jgi:hypothetical protein
MGTRRPAAWRLRLPPGDIVIFEDRLQERWVRRVAISVIGHYRRDGVPAYHITVVIDDQRSIPTSCVAPPRGRHGWQVASPGLGLSFPGMRMPLVIEPDDKPPESPACDHDLDPGARPAIPAACAGPPAQLRALPQPSSTGPLVTGISGASGPAQRRASM